MLLSMRTVLVVGLLLTAFDAQEEAVKKDVKQLQGTWTVVGAEQNGQALGRIKGGTLKVKETNFVIKTKAGTEMEGDLRLDPSKKPKSMDLVHQKGLLRDKTWEAVYELTGDDLKICYAEADKGKERPTDFTAAQDSGRLLVILKREKK